jgi:subtilisin
MSHPAHTTVGHIPVTVDTGVRLRRVTTWLVAGLGICACAMPAAGAARPERGHRYVVVYVAAPHSGFSVQAETAARERAEGFVSDHRFRHAIDGFAARLTDAQARTLRADPEVALVARDGKLHAARVPLADGEKIPPGVARIGAAGRVAGVHPPSSAAVAVLDTGIDLGHKDLVARAGKNCTGSGSGPPEDDNGHGTFVAGVIGARNDGAGVVGVAPGTEVYAVKVLGARGEGEVSDLLCGVEWVTANAAALGIRVANMSLRGFVVAEPLHAAIRRSIGAGVVYTAAAGNTATDLSYEVPAAFPEVLTVTAVSDSDGAPGGTGPAPSCETGTGEIDDSFATFSNFATRPEDVAHVVAAPGVCVTSTARGGGEDTRSGTSAAAPHVAGVVALCMGEAGRPGPCADMAPAEVIEQVRADAAANATLENGFLGDPFRPVGVTYGHLVSAADPTVRRIASRQAPTAASAPARPDTTVEVLALRIRRTQDVDRLQVVARLAEAGTVTATVGVRFRGGTARLVRAHRTGKAIPNRTLRLRLHLPAAALRSVKHALRHGRRVHARVTVTATDAAGNARANSRRVRLRP